MISRVLRGGGGSVYIEKGRLIRAPARSPLRVTEPDKPHVTYPDSTSFSRNGFFGMFPKQTNLNFPQQNKTAKGGCICAKVRNQFWRTIQSVGRARALPGPARRASARVCSPSSAHLTCFKWLGGHPPF